MSITIIVLVFLAIGGVSLTARLAARARVAEAEAAAEEARRKQAQLAEAAEAERRDDARYDRTINCPGCEGTGECYMSFDYAEAHTLHWYSSPSRHRSSDEHSGKTRCPLCEGSGIAHAFLATESCPDCNGTGENTIMVKAEVGMEKKTVPCSICRGKRETIVANVKFVDKYRINDSLYLGDEFGGTRVSLSGSVHKVKLPVTPVNQAFFDKWKPRESLPN